MCFYLYRFMFNYVGIVYVDFRDTQHYHLDTFNSTNESHQSEKGF